MGVTPQQIRICLDKAREIAREYRTYAIPGDATKKSVDDLRRVCATYLNKRIVIYEVQNLPREGATIATYIAYQDHCEIYFRGQLPLDWQRFAVCKELFHVIIDMEEHRDLDLTAQLEGMLLPVAQEVRGAVAWEWFAEISAMEFLFPYADRVAILKAGRQPDSQLGNQYGLPLTHIERYLSDAAMKYFDAFRADGD